MTPHAQQPLAPLDQVERSTTRRDRIVSVLLALVNVPAFAMMLLFALLWGPEQFFGEYDRAAGHQAVIGLVLILVAVVAWAFFFASYARAGRANVLGFVVLGTAATLDAVLMVQKVRSLSVGRPDSGLPTPVPWLNYAIPVAWASFAALSAVAIRHPRMRGIAVAPLAAAALVGLVWLIPQLSAGDASTFWLLIVPAPFLTPFLLLVAVVPDHARASSR